MNRWVQLSWLMVMIGCSPAAELRIGAKAMPESVILAHAASQLAREEQITASVEELGGTEVVWAALNSGRIDAYPEYTGTLREQILLDEDLHNDAELREALKRRGIGMTEPLGFENGYAIGMTETRANELGIKTLADLKRFPNLRMGFSSEFIQRADCWPGLKARYGLPQQNPLSMEHALTYDALAKGSIDATDLYTTDAEIIRYKLLPLEDNLHYFPNYAAVFLYRLDLVERRPASVQALDRLIGRVSAKQMIEMNYQAVQLREPEQTVAANFLRENFDVELTSSPQQFWIRLLKLTGQHLSLVAISLTAAVCTAIPLGVLAARRPRFGQIVLSSAGIIQTIPTLALLVFMIPLFGLGTLPAIVALYLYSLLPILRNTVSGLRDIAPNLKESAEGLGLTSWQQLRFVELPLAARSILAGVKTAAVINVGTATLGALIGAGGLGQLIQEGLRLNDRALILAGAVPAALLAIVVQGLFEGLERLVVPLGLRLPTTR